MHQQKSIIRALPWIQLFLSIIFASSIVWGYAIIRTPLVTAFEALSNSIYSVIDVIEATAVTVGAKDELIATTRQTLAQTREAIRLSSQSIANQMSGAGKRAKELEAASSLIFRTSDALNKLADGLIEITAPNRIEFDGLKPVVVMNRPLSPYGNELKPIAKDIRTIGNGIQNLSITLTTDGVKMGVAFSQLGDQTIKMLEQSEHTLEQIQNQNLPHAVQEMRRAAENLKTATKEISTVSNSFGLLALIAGLIISVWLFLNSINMILLARNQQT